MQAFAQGAQWEEGVFGELSALGSELPHRKDSLTVLSSVLTPRPHNLPNPLLLDCGPHGPGSVCALITFPGAGFHLGAGPGHHGLSYSSELPQFWTRGPLSNSKCLEDLCGVPWTSDTCICLSFPQCC